MALKQGLYQKQLQKLSPQQIQLMKMLQLPTIELEKRIKEELEENPALDEGVEQQKDDFEDNAEDQQNEDFDIDISSYISDDETPSYKLRSNNYSNETDEKSIPLSGGSTFRETLKSQIDLRIKDENQLVIANQIIGNLDESGYLRREIFNIVDDLAFSQNIHTSEEEVEYILTMIQSLEPSGVGARDLKECLLIQLRKKQTTFTIKTAEVIIEKYFDAFTKKHYKKIIDKLDIQTEDFKEAIDEIIKLNPKPGNSLIDTSKVVQHVIPDFIITDNNGELNLELNSRNEPQLKISNQYVEMLRGYEKSKKTKKDKEAILFVKQKIDAAAWFVDAIKQRRQTLLTTMQAIMNYQESFFISGDETDLKPMILKDIANIIKMDISTISRVANSKHVSTPFGTFLLKYFFSESLTTQSGEEVSTREVKSILQEIINQENKSKPLTDEKLMNMLKDKGYNIARRTIAKYREQLNIPVARLRKQLL